MPRNNLVLYKHQQNIIDNKELEEFRDSMYTVTRERNIDVSDDPRPATYCMPMYESRVDTYRYYHLSPEKGLTKLEPYIPKDRNKFEDGRTPRVAFNTSINNCLMGMYGDHSNKDYYVYIPAPYEFPKAITPHTNQVPAGQITGEVWYTNPVNVRCIGQIHVLHPDDSKPHIYQPDSSSSTISELYEWNYRQIQNEYAMLPMMNNTPLPEPVIEQAMYSDRRCMPVFIVLMHSGTPMASVVKFVSGAEYSHCCLAFNPELSPHYSFGLKKLGMNPLHPQSVGFYAQTPKDPLYKKYKNTKYSVYVMYVTPKQYGDMQRALQVFIDNKDDLRYDFVNLISVWMGIQSEESEKWFCSKFIAKVIDAGYKLGKVPSLWMPMDFADLKNVSLCCKGDDFYYYNPKVTKLNLELIKKKDYSSIQFQYRQFSDDLKRKMGYLPKKESYDSQPYTNGKQPVVLELPNVSRPSIKELFDNTPMDHIWLTSDWHMFKNHYKKERNYVNVREILQWCQRNLGKEDLFVYLGDLSFRYAVEEDLEKVKDAIRSIPCRRILILGNHDKMLGLKFFNDCGFDYVFESYKWRNYIFTHAPINLMGDSDINIHGHKHNVVEYYTSDGKRHINVYPAFFDNKPVTLKYIDTHIPELTKDHKQASRVMFGEQTFLIGSLSSPFRESSMLSKIKNTLRELYPEKVYFSRRIDGDTILKLVRLAKPNLFNDKSTLIKIHFGERDNNHFIDPNIVRPLALETQSVLGDCNVAYDSKDKRDTMKHIKLAQEHGFNFCPIDILDSEGEMELYNPMHNKIDKTLTDLDDEKIMPYESTLTSGTHLKTTTVGSHLKDYDQLIVFTHFKGHDVAGMGGSIKNIGMGCASAKTGKLKIHGKDWSCLGRLFMERLTESAYAIDELFKDNVVYINILNNLSTECDCVNGAPEPTMPDLGVLVSTSLIAIDQASYDLVKLNNESHDLIQTIADKGAVHQIEYLKWLSEYETFNYELYNINGNIVNKEDYSKLVNYQPEVNNESLIFSRDDILYNTNKWESGEINIAYVLGFSGSGKSSLSRLLSANYDNCENIELDEVLFNWKYTDAEIKKWSSLLYAFFTTVGKQYRLPFDKIVKLDASQYELPMMVDLITFAKDYAHGHPEKRFILEGVWPMMFGVEASEFKDWTVYIKGTSYLTSTYRAIKRDVSQGQYFHFARYIAKYRPSIAAQANTVRMNMILNQYIKYFNNLQTNEQKSNK